MNPELAKSTDPTRDVWNERYAQRDLLWSAGPNRFVEAELSGMAPGRALDLAAGEGRNAIWLAEQGWKATAVDFSDVAIEKGRARARDSGLSITWIVEDLISFRPEPGAFDLVLLAYLHLRRRNFLGVVRNAATALVPGGTILVIGHDASNIDHGVGGPQDPTVLYSAADITAVLRGFEVKGAGMVLRPVNVEGVEHNAIDVLVRAVKAKS
ncbi:MAG TPA: class I SAM-dependent methyltransferase [Chloroflexota bacterium]|nr:class I SAM-dependent methyltransferase [Chloroflexota bacterium]